MSAWCNWYRVVKHCGRSEARYIYDQSTRRVDGRTETRNRYIGLVGGGAIRSSFAGQGAPASQPSAARVANRHRAAVITGLQLGLLAICNSAEARGDTRTYEMSVDLKQRLDGMTLQTIRHELLDMAERADAGSKDEILLLSRALTHELQKQGSDQNRLSRVFAGLEKKDRVELTARNTEVLSIWPRNFLNFNLQAFVDAADGIGVDLQRELRKVDRKPTIAAKIETLHRLWGLLHEADPTAGVKSRLRHIRDAAIQEDKEAVAGLDAVLADVSRLDRSVLTARLVEIAMRAEQPFVRREVGEIVENLLKARQKETSP